MDMDRFDFELCDLPEKQVVEGLCLSYDLLRGFCLETMGACLAAPRDTEIQESTESDPFSISE